MSVPIGEGRLINDVFIADPAGGKAAIALNPNTPEQITDARAYVARECADAPTVLAMLGLT